MSNETEGEIFALAWKNCSFPPVLYETQPIIGVWHIHDLFVLIAGLLTIGTLIFSLGSAVYHLRNYNVPRGQSAHQRQHQQHKFHHKEH